MNDKKGVLRKEFTRNGAKLYEGESLPKPLRGRGCTDWVLVGSLLLVACTRSLDGMDVQIECGFVSLLSEIASLGGGDVPGGDLMLDVGIMKRAKNRDRCSMFNARNFEG